MRRADHHSSPGADDGTDAVAVIPAKAGIQRLSDQALFASSFTDHDASSAGFMGLDPEPPDSGSRRETAPAPDVVHRYPYWAIRESHFASHTPRSRMYLASPGCTGTRSTAASTPRRCMWAMSA